MKDVYDTTVKYPEFRLTNLAQMEPEENTPVDRFVITHQYINRPYGCFINRGSKITIVSPSSALEVMTGWFAHYLAMVGGFNLISKEVEPNIGDFDSFAAMSSKIKVSGYSYEELIKDKHANVDKLRLYEQKERSRNEFFQDLQTVSTGEDSWLIYLNTAIMNSTNSDEFHFTMSKKGGKDPVVLDGNISRYKDLVERFAKMVKENFGYSAVPSDRYPLPVGFSGYKLRQQKTDALFNAFKINIGAPAIKDNRRMILIYKMA